MLEYAAKIYFLKKMKICIPIKITHTKGYNNTKKRHDYELDLIIGYIGANLPYEERE